MKKTKCFKCDYYSGNWKMISGSDYNPIETCWKHKMEQIIITTFICIFLFPFMIAYCWGENIDWLIKQTFKQKSEVV